MEGRAECKLCLGEDWKLDEEEKAARKLKTNNKHEGEEIMHQ